MMTAIVDEIGNHRWEQQSSQSMTIFQQSGQQSSVMTAMVDEAEIVDNHRWEQQWMAIIDNRSNG